MLVEIVLEAQRKGFSVQSNTARTNASYVAMAASLGLISTRVYGNVFAADWRPTVKGLAWLNELDLIADDDT